MSSAVIGTLRHDSPSPGPILSWIRFSQGERACEIPGPVLNLFGSRGGFPRINQVAVIRRAVDRIAALGKCEQCAGQIAMMMLSAARRIAGAEPNDVMFVFTELVISH